MNERMSAAGQGCQERGQDILEGLRHWKSRARDHGCAVLEEQVGVLHDQGVVGKEKRGSRQR